ncbi:Lrp/AsnC family transcriptional regulator [Nocardia tengchongensis]|uniref:Lrp/AsnC family transcriptional regulator n=1 Tax=Nocardia tengchongensis TaxID=2055889 RepID=UPI0036B87107
MTSVDSRGLVEAPRLSELDYKIIASLKVDGRMSFREIARELGVSEKSVRRRYQELVGENVLEIACFIHPSCAPLHGWAIVGIIVDPEGSIVSTADALAAMADIDYVAIVAGKFDIFAEIVCETRDQLLEFLDGPVRKIPNLSRIRVYPYLERFYDERIGPGLFSPAPDVVELSDIDAKIVRELSIDARVPFRTVADRIDASEVMVRRRMKRMTDTGLLRITAITNPATSGLEAGAAVAVELGEGASARAVAERLSAVASINYVALCAGGADIIFEILARNEGELGQLLDEQVRPIDGIQRLEAFTYLKLHYKSSRLYATFQLESLTRGRGGVVTTDSTEETDMSPTG